MDDHSGYHILNNQLPHIIFTLKTGLWATEPKPARGLILRKNIQVLLAKLVRDGQGPLIHSYYTWIAFFFSTFDWSLIDLESWWIPVSLLLFPPYFLYGQFSMRMAQILSYFCFVYILTKLAWCKYTGMARQKRSPLTWEMLAAGGFYPFLFLSFIVFFWFALTWLFLDR